MDINSINRHDIETRFEALGENERAALRAEKPLADISRICLEEKILDGEKILAIQQLCGLLSLGFIEVEGFSSAISRKTGLNKEISDNISRRAENEVLAPLGLLFSEKKTGPIGAVTNASSVTPLTPKVYSPQPQNAQPKMRGESSIPKTFSSIGEPQKIAGMNTPVPIMLHRENKPVESIKSDIYIRMPGSNIGASSNLMENGKITDTIPPRVARVEIGAGTQRIAPPPPAPPKTTMEPELPMPPSRFSPEVPRPNTISFKTEVAEIEPQTKKASLGFWAGLLKKQTPESKENGAAKVVNYSG